MCSLRMVRSHLRFALLLTSLASARGQVQILHGPTEFLGRDASVKQLTASARGSLERGDLEGARSILERVLSREERNKQARLALTDVLRRMKRWRDAADQAQILVQQYPSDTEPVYLLALIAMQRGDPHTAQELARDCVARGDKRSEVYKVLALSDYLLHDKTNFESKIESILRKNPRDAEAQYLLARYLFEEKRYGEALNRFHTVVAIQPDHYKAYYYSGLIYNANGDRENAQTAWMTSIGIVERKQAVYGWPFADLGRALSDAGETDQAIEWTSRGVRNDPACPKTYYEHARAIFQRRPEPEVKRALLEAIRLDPGYADAYYMLGRYYKKVGEDQAGDQILDRFRDVKAHPVPSPYGLPRQ